MRAITALEPDYPARLELDELPSNMKVVHVLSRPGASWRGPRGHVDQTMLQSLSGTSLRGASVFLRGPSAFMEEVCRSLRQLGIPRARIHAERFAMP